MISENLSLLLAGGAFCISLAALIVAILDWNQIGREEPWKLIKVETDIWLLERVHRSPVVVLSFLNFHGSPVETLNDATMPVGVFRRGRREVLHIENSQLGTFLVISFRRSRGRILEKLMGEEKFQWKETGLYVEGAGVDHWSTPIY